MTFFVGLHQPSDCRRFPRSFVSVNRLRSRRADFRVQDWILDSGAFSELARYGHYREGVEDYAAQVERWSRCGNLLAAVTQDYMCEPHMLAKTGLSVAEHQHLTLERYRALRQLVRSTYVMPVLQGYRVAEYVRHVRAYGRLLRPGAWVGVSDRSASETPTWRPSVQSCGPPVRRGPIFVSTGLASKPLRSTTLRFAACSSRPIRWRGASTHGVTAETRIAGARRAAS